MKAHVTRVGAHVGTAIFALTALAAGALAPACSAAPPEVVEPGPQPPPAATPPPPAPTVVPAATAAPEPTAAPAKTEEPAGPTACPAGMKLVEGDYCTDVEQKCQKSWFDKSNKKTICEIFEPKSTCVGQKVKKRYCIDTYEWPNQKGVRPEVMNYFYQAQVKCAAVGKRMCTESEWTFACEGPEMLPYPYGYVRDANKCNGDHMWDDPDMKKVAKRDAKELARLWHGMPSGSQPECVSPFGVHDMPGNTDEVCSLEPGGKGKYDSVHTGGPWYKGVRNQCRPKVYTHKEDFYYYFLSFRCCAEPDGAPTDPRTPKQIKDKWAFKKVEQIATFSVEQVKEKLALKAKGECTCGEKDIKCKTMCGTLLGPDLKDAVPGVR